MYVCVCVCMSKMVCVCLHGLRSAVCVLLQSRLLLIPVTQGLFAKKSVANGVNSFNINRKTKLVAHKLATTENKKREE